MQLVHLEPVENAVLDRLDQICGLEPGLLLPVAANECGALEDDAVELARRGFVRPGGADQTARVAATPREARGRASS